MRGRAWGPGGNRRGRGRGEGPGGVGGAGGKKEGGGGRRGEEERGGRVAVLSVQNRRIGDMGTSERWGWGRVVACERSLARVFIRGMGARCEGGIRG
jgi:hypothetical protein